MDNSRINILWIEDNPLLSERIANNGHDGTEKVKKAGKDFIIPSMKSLKNDSNHFNLKILQHPEEIKEYLAMCSKVVETKGANYLSHADGVIPDIVVFDYMLNENFTTSTKNSISYATVMKPIREMFNPTYSFLKKEYDDIFGNYVLFPERSSNYTDEILFRQINYDKGHRLAKTIEKDIANTKDDEFGLYAGVLIVRFFKEYVTCGLPATFNKKDRGSLQPTAKYFEWLNGYDLESALQRENKGNKNWKNILSDGAALLRKRIESQLATGKIMIAYSHLNELSKEKLPGERVFTFESIYGSKNLPLDGLFIDVGKNERDATINEWAKVLLGVYASKSGFKFNEYEKAKDISLSLIKQYQANEEVDKRDKLSELVVKLILGNLSAEEDKTLQDLMSHFGVSDRAIKLFMEGQDAENSNLTKHDVDFRKLKTGLPKIDRLIVLFSDLWLHKVYQDFTKRAGKGEEQFYLINQLLERPGYNELRAVLFPIAKNPLVLPYHFMYLPEKYQETKSGKKKRDPFDSWDKHLGRDMGEFHIGPKTEYPANLSDPEKRVCLSFTNEIKLDKHFYPNWLNN